MELQDKLTGALIGLARATDGNEHLISDSSTAVMVESLRAIRRADKDLSILIRRVEEEKRKMVPDCFLCACPCGKNSDYDMKNLLAADADIRELKIRILAGIRDLADRIGEPCEQHVSRFFYKALIVIGMDDYGLEDLEAILLEMEELRGELRS